MTSTTPASSATPPGSANRTRYLRHSFDFTRLIGQILEPLRRDGELHTVLAHLDLATDTFTAHRTYTIDAGTVVLVEGVFLLRPQLRRFLDLTVYLHVPEQTALLRGATRDTAPAGVDVAGRYRSKYLPAQREFLRQHPPAELADLIVDNTDWDRPRVLRRGPRRPRAVAFDLWNTLVPFPDATKQRAFTRTAAALGIPEAELAARWAQTRALRETRPVQEYLRWLRTDLSAGWPPQAAAMAAQVRRQVHGQCFTEAAVRASAGVLTLLRAAGLKTAVVSNCSSDVRDMLTASPLAGLLDAVVLSAEVGVMKPDPAIYTRAAAEVGLRPADCLYVGDGGDDELAGAEAAGMAPVLLDLGERRHWAGRRVQTLAGVLTLLNLDTDPAGRVDRAGPAGHADPLPAGYPPAAENLEAW
jgi:HAD superfamily hydrolase (TIGR01509 family)